MCRCAKNGGVELATNMCACRDAQVYTHLFDVFRASKVNLEENQAGVSHSAQLSLLTLEFLNEEGGREQPLITLSSQGQEYTDDIFISVHGNIDKHWVLCKAH